MSWAEEHQVGECLNVIADELEKITQILTKVSKLEGGMGIVKSLMDSFAIRNAQKERR